MNVSCSTYYSSTVNLHIRGPLWQTVGHPFSLLLGQPNSAIKAQTLYCLGRWRTVCRNASGRHWAILQGDPDLAITYFQSTLLIHICNHNFFEWMYITICWLKLQFKNALFCATREIHGAVRYLCVCNSSIFWTRWHPIHKAHVHDSGGSYTIILPSQGYTIYLLRFGYLSAAFALGSHVHIVCVCVCVFTIPNEPTLRLFLLRERDRGFFIAVLVVQSDLALNRNSFLRYQQ